MPAAKIGLGVFLAVVGSLFALFISAYFMRMSMADWRPLPVPALLWLNTGVLVLSSVALQWARRRRRPRRPSAACRTGLARGRLHRALVFLVGQLLAWRQLAAAGYLLDVQSGQRLLLPDHRAARAARARRPRRAGRGDRARRGAARRSAQLRLSVELCAIYWHFLLFVWLVLFGLLLLGWTQLSSSTICRAVLTGRTS